MRTGWGEEGLIRNKAGGHRGEPFRGAYKITPSQISANLGLALRDQ